VLPIDVYFKIAVLPIDVYFTDQLGQSHVARASDIRQALPELVFKTDARLVPPITTDRLEIGDFMASPQVGSGTI
jgi:hypothetical protein